MQARDTKPEDRSVYKIKMSAPVAAYIKGKHRVALKLPLIFAPGTRILLVEFCGAPTGRADLCTVVSTDGNLLHLVRNWCWQQGKFDDDLSSLSLTVLPDELKMADKSCIPKEDENEAKSESVSGSEPVSTGEEGSGSRAEAPEAS